MRRRSIIALGLAGGLVPAPSAIVVLLGALAFGQAFFGILLVLAYGVGMALTLVGAGWAVMHLRARASRRLNWFESKGAALVPAVTALVLVGAGLVLTARGITGI
jgi:ABC-type nickel/cobalt efflux system permease component RcnA